MDTDSTTFGTQTDTFKIVGGQEGVMIVHEGSGKVIMTLSDTEAIELANILRQKTESGS